MPRRVRVAVPSCLASNPLPTPPEALPLHASPRLATLHARHVAIAGACAADPSNHTLAAAARVAWLLLASAVASEHGFAGVILRRHRGCIVEIGTQLFLPFPAS